MDEDVDTMKCILGKWFVNLVPELDYFKIGSGVGFVVTMTVGSIL